MQQGIDFWHPAGTNIIIVRQFIIAEIDRSKPKHWWQRWRRKQQRQQPKGAVIALWGNDGPGAA